jgi:serine/threonine protein kinase/tetratricopeptide (TPR) repeat protein
MMSEKPNEPGSGERTSPDAATVSVDADGVRLRAGEWVGPYRLFDVIGSGGFGVVWLAEQREPLRRRVALKVIKPGMDTDSVVARFEAERNALGVMDHPNIAKVYDGGTTERGLPYFVMEHVPGEPITSYCTRRKLGLLDRLAVFAQVCRAVQHAHSKGVIHRDLKPSNILVREVDNEPVAKVIDFGVAKALDQRLNERTLFTALGHMVGTPEYMAPEQAEGSGRDIDTRADVYSLGVVLYELLTGQRPFDLREVAWHEVSRVISEVSPPKPSTRVFEALAGTKDPASSETRSLARALKNDLDWVVMRCLEKDRSRRYQTAQALADELTRFAAGDPVEAGPPSFGYRARKFAKRHRGAIGLVSSVAAVLVVTSGVAISGWSRAISNEQMVRKALTREERLRAFVIDDIIQAPIKASVGVTVVDAIEDALSRVDDRLGDDPYTAFLMRKAAAEALFYGGLPGKALRTAREAESRIDAVSGEVEDDGLGRERLFNRSVIAAGLSRIGQRVDAEAEYASLEADAVAEFGPDHSFVWSVRANRAVNLERMGDFRSALPILEAVVRDRSRTESPRSSGLISNRLSLVRSRAVLNEADDAPRAARLELVDEARAVFEDAQAPQLAGIHDFAAASNLVHALAHVGDAALADEGEAIATEWIGIAETRIGPNSLSASTLYAHRGWCRILLGDYGGAESDLRRSISSIGARTSGAEPTRGEIIVRARLVECLRAAGADEAATELDLLLRLDPLERITEIDPARRWLESVLAEG